MKIKTLLSLLLLASTAWAQGPGIVPLTSAQITANEASTAKTLADRDNGRLVLNTDTKTFWKEYNQADGTGSVFRTVDHIPVSSSKTVDVEAGSYNFVGPNPAVVHIDLDPDTYQQRHGPLVVQPQTGDRELRANAVVFGVALGAGAGGTDRYMYYPIEKTIEVDAANHGLVGELYIGVDGQLTDVRPDAYRVMSVGMVATADTLILHPPEESLTPDPCTLEFTDVKAWNVIDPSLIASITPLSGNVEIYEADALSVASPTSAQLIAAITDRDNAGQLRFNGANTGIEITFSNKLYMSHASIRLMSQIRWYGDILSQTGVRPTFDVEFYNNATDPVPAVTQTLWDRANGPVKVDRGSDEKAVANTVVEKIRLVWPANTLSSLANGGLELIRFWPKETMTTIRVEPGGSPIEWDHWEIPLAQRIRSVSNTMDAAHFARVGGLTRANEVSRGAIYGKDEAWNSGQPEDFDVVDSRSLRGYRYGTSIAGVWPRDSKLLSIDIEQPPVVISANDSPLIASQKAARYLRAISATRSLWPSHPVGAYEYPLREYINVGEALTSANSNAQAFYANAKLASSLYAPIVAGLDYAAPTLYFNFGGSVSAEDWKATAQWMIDECHRQGKLCIPHISGWNYLGGGTNSALDPVVAEELLTWLFVEAGVDGVMFWDVNFAGDSLWSDAEKEAWAQVQRNVLDKLIDDAPVVTPTISRKEGSDDLGNQVGTDPIDFDAGDFDNKLITVTGPRLLSWTPTRNGVYSVTVVQDGTGGHIVNWPTVVGEKPVINQGANERTTLTFYWDGNQTIVLGERVRLVIDTLADIVAYDPTLFPVGTSIRVVDDGVNNGEYIANGGSVGGFATSWEKDD